MTAARTRRPAGGRWRALTAALLVTAGAGGVALLAGCDSSGGGSGSATGFATSPRPTLSGSLPAILDSLASAGRSAASHGASSAKAAASSLEASVKARVEGDDAAAREALAKAPGQGNAVDDVTLSGVPREQTGGLHTVVVTIRNTSGGTASLAVEIEFAAASGAIVDTEYVDAKDVRAGKHATAIAFTTKDSEATLFPRVARAQRY